MARPSRKKQGRGAPLPDASARVWRTALYVRLSVEDNGRDSDSVENQIALLEAFAAAHPDLRRTALFVDNGYTGTDFLRPEFRRMMEAVQRGTIDCIVVKDLSRLGRDYIETSRFIEKICPFYGLRLIAVNDGFDTETAAGGEQLSASLANIINDYYAKDISRKVTSALRTKMERGDYIGHYPPHGYQRDPANRNHLVICPETAPVIRQIFAWRAEGVSYMGIDRRLNDAGVPSPGQYRLDHGLGTGSPTWRPVLWSRHMITKILSDTVYLGQLVQRKTRQCLYRGIPSHVTGEEEWIVVKDTHEPIVSRELFEAVQRVNRACAERAKASSGRYAHLPKERNIYGKRFVCGCCGRAMRLQRSLSTDRTRAYFTFLCPAFAEHGARGCAGVKIRKADVDEAVFRFIRAQMEAFLDREQALQRLAARKSKPGSDGTAGELRSLQQTLDRKKSLLGTLYTDLKEGSLSQEEYGQHRAVVLSDMEGLQARIAALSARQTESEGPRTGAMKWRQMVERYRGAEALSAEMVDAFVDTMVLRPDRTLEIRLRYGDELAALPEADRRRSGEAAS